MTAIRFLKMRVVCIGLIATLVACGPEGFPSNEPVVLSFEELRQPIVMLDPKPIFENGKIVTYQSYILVNEPGKGVHLINNEDPANPAAIGFLPIFGNSDVVVKDNLLYVNSYVDLLVFDISDISDIQLKARVENTFMPPYDPGWWGVGPDEGVIISFELAGTEDTI